MSEFEGLVAVVTGGAAGIGAAVAARFLSGGARVAVLDNGSIDPASGVLAVAADVGDDSSINSAIDQVVAAFGGIDIVVNNAGIPAAGDIAANSSEEWQTLFNVNVIGIARVTRAALPYLRRSGHPVIVNLSSITATVGVPNRALYSATKGAILSLTRAMAADHLNENIRVNCVCPGSVDTRWHDNLIASADDPEAALIALKSRQPHGRLVSPEEVADAIAYIANPRSGSVTGIALSVDGGANALRMPSQ